MTRNKIKQPKSAVIAITYQCNSRCRMCNIWQKKPELGLKSEIYKKLPISLDDINITGGEPFLRDDLLEILDIIFNRCHPDKVVISTNGFLTETILKRAKEILNKKYAKKVTIAVSLDGIEDIHDKIRGLPGAYNRAIATIIGLKNINFNNIGVGFTFSAGNEKEYLKVYKLSQKMNLNFGATIAHNSDNYFSIQNNRSINSILLDKQINVFVDEKIKSFKKNELGKCYYMHGLAHYAKTNKQLVKCDALRGFFFLDPNGNIYPCNILNKIVGNIKNKTFTEIWESKTAKQARACVKNCKTPC